MDSKTYKSGQNRRDFLKRTAGSGAALLLGGGIPAPMAAASTNWRKHAGIELYTVRDLLAKNFEGTIARVADIGYKEVEPISYGGLDAKQFRALLNRYYLTAPSTHTTATEGPDLDKQLDDQRVMGFKYTQIAPPRGSTPAHPARTVDWAKRLCEQYNRQGALAERFDMKILIHNHTGEFEPLENSGMTEYDVLLANTDPKVVAMQLDIGWACIAGKNVIEMFNKNPGRFELWHVKDAVGIKDIPPNTPPGKRRAKFVPVGQGEIDYKTIFANAELAGLRHYAVEQDNAGDNGADSMAAARASFEGLMRIL